MSEVLGLGLDEVAGFVDRAGVSLDLTSVRVLDRGDDALRRRGAQVEDVFCAQTP